MSAKEPPNKEIKWPAERITNPTGRPRVESKGTTGPKKYDGRQLAAKKQFTNKGPSAYGKKQFTNKGSGSLVGQHGQEMIHPIRISNNQSNGQG